MPKKWRILGPAIKFNLCTHVHPLRNLGIFTEGAGVNLVLVFTMYACATLAGFLVSHLFVTAARGHRRSHCRLESARFTIRSHSET